MKEAREFALTHREQHLSELKEFLRIESISTLDTHRDEVAAAAAWLAGTLANAGLENVQVIETANHPLVYADWLHASRQAPTVLVYGHYDVQPPDPLELWESPPFEPTVRQQYIYARGSSDDKGQLYAHVKAVESYLAAGLPLPVNVKFIVEGEEEIGGTSLEAFIPEHKEMLSADVALVSDSNMNGPSSPSIVYGLRGLVYALIDINGPAHDLHSGRHGGGIDNPLNVMSRLIARLQDEDGHILIPGFYDKVRPLAAEEREFMAGYPFDETAWLQETGAPHSWGEPEFSLMERLGARPTLDVNGIVGGYTQPGKKTVLPASVHAKISMRLVPDQDPQEISELFRRYVESLIPPTVTAKISAAETLSWPSMTDITDPAMQAATTALATVFGSEPVFHREGGSIPVVAAFQQHLGLETILMGFGLSDDRIHSPNERFYLPNFYRGIEASIEFMKEYASTSDAP